MKQIISAIYAVSENGVIGKDNDLPWHLPNDFKFFKRYTMGKPILMGRRSFEALGKPLPGRRNIVITRNPDYPCEGIEIAHSLKEAIDMCSGVEEICITGGAGIYRQSIEEGYVNLIKETLVHAEVEGDTFFQIPNPEDWEIVEVDACQADERHEYAYTFRTLRRKK